MKIEPKLKPLYVNLKRLNLGTYLSTQEFTYFVTELNLDESWERCLSEVNLDLAFIDTIHYKNEVEEKAFGIFMSLWYKTNYLSFGDFITKALLRFSKWNKTQLDFNSVLENLKQIGLTDESVLEFTKKARKIRDTKPINIVEPITTKTKVGINQNINKVFIVHGHDDDAKSKTARFVEKLGFEAIILHEQASSSMTIIEKIEKYSNVGFGIVLYTPCDLGAKREDNSNLKPRARQNVVFEHGFLIGKIGRSNVCALVKGNIETPNDISGVVYVTMDSAESWKYTIAKEMQKASYSADLNKI